MLRRAGLKLVVMRCLGCVGFVWRSRGKREKGSRKVPGERVVVSVHVSVFAGVAICHERRAPGVCETVDGVFVRFSWPIASEEATSAPWIASRYRSDGDTSLGSHTHCDFMFSAIRDLGQHVSEGGAALICGHW